MAIMSEGPNKNQNPQRNNQSAQFWLKIAPLGCLELAFGALIFLRLGCLRVCFWIFANLLALVSVIPRKTFVIIDSVLRFSKCRKNQVKLKLTLKCNYRHRKKYRAGFGGAILPLTHYTLKKHLGNNHGAKQIPARLNTYKLPNNTCTRENNISLTLRRNLLILRQRGFSRTISAGWKIIGRDPRFTHEVKFATNLLITRK